MNKAPKLKLITVLLLCASYVFAYDWDRVAIPENLLDQHKNWILNEDLSDDFSYDFAPKTTKTNFGPADCPNKWYNFYHSNWDGPGATKWVHENVEVKDGSLMIHATRPIANEQKWMTEYNVNRTATRTACFTSNKKVSYPAFVEAYVRLSALPVASCFWMLSPDDAQEIDILEAYGGINWYKKFLHLSHHYFDRTPFTDYQPKDWGSWYMENGKNDWLDQDIRIGVYWRDPLHLEYYVNGVHVRTISDKALWSKNGFSSYAGLPAYGYYKKTNGVINGHDAYTTVYPATSLDDANAESDVSIIDGYNYLAVEPLHQGKPGLWKDLDLIINVEVQSWHAYENRIPTDAQIEAEKNDPFKVHWVRVYHPGDDEASVEDNKVFDFANAYYDKSSSQIVVRGENLFQAKLYSIGGIPITTQRVGVSNEIFIPVANVSEGIYFIQVLNNENQMQTIKLML